MHATEALAEADRIMIVCNSCRYCEGLCAVFPAMEMRRSFADTDLNYLANLCHGCGACYDDCQFSPPHEYQVNVPKTLAAVRADSYAAYAWPGVWFMRNGGTFGFVVVISILIFVLAMLDGNAPERLFSRLDGNFYALMSHNTMALAFGLALLAAVATIALSASRFARDIAAGLRDPALLHAAARDAVTLKYLDGGGLGCMVPGEQGADPRKLAHHLTAGGFLLCLAATSVATLYHYLLGREAPYPWWDLPVLLGTAGGIGLTIGPILLLRAKFRRDKALADPAASRMDSAFTVMLLLTGVSGLALLLLRGSAAMGMLLAVHLGIVFALFLTLPYGKFVHGIYRFIALVRSARERRMLGEGVELV